MKRLTLATLVLCGISFFAHADESPYSKSYYTCLRGSGSATVEKHACIVEEYLRQDARLDLAYRSLLGELRGRRNQELIEAQRLWIQYRRANCKVYAYQDEGPALDGGSMTEVNAATCNLYMTARRAEELESLIVA